MLGYFVTYDFNNKNIKYEIGKTYSIETTDIEKYGFKFFKSLEDIKDLIDNHSYTVYDSDKVFQLEILGDVINVENTNLFVTNKIKIIKQLSITEHNLFKYKQDDKGNVIYYKLPTGLEIWKEYDDKGNVIYYKDSSGVEIWKEYDDRGHIIHYKDSSGVEYWKEYDDKGRVIYGNVNNVEIWKKYDDNGNLIYYKDSRTEYYNKYDENNKLIYHKQMYGTNCCNEEWYEYENNNLISTKQQYADGTYQIFDKDRNLIYLKDSDGIEYKLTIED